MTAYDDFNKPVQIDGDTDCLNQMSGEKLKSVILSTLNTVIETLGEHCGPGAKTAWFVSRDDLGEALYVPKFSNDGISITKRMQFMNPVQHYVSRIISYVGKRVDDRSKDGTTTAMIMAAFVMRQIVLMKDDPNYRFIKKPNAIKSIFGKIKSDLLNSPSVFTKDTFLPRVHEWWDGPSDAAHISEIYAYLAGVIANIASKGDKELCSVVEELFRQRPVETLKGSTAITTSRYETDVRFRLDNDVKANYYFHGMTYCGDQYYNHALGSEYKNDDCEMIVTYDPIIPGNPDYVYIKKYIEDETKTKDLVIITSRQPDPTIPTMVNTYNKSHKTKILVVGYTALIKGNIRSALTDLHFINYTANKFSPGEAFEQDLDETAYIHPSVSIYIHNNNMVEINSLSSDDIEGPYNPRYIKKDNPYYNKALEELTTEIKNQEESHTPNGALLTYWKDVYTNALCRYHPCVLMIGGSSTEATANQDVVQDVVGSVLAVLNDGFVVDGIRTLLRVAQSHSIKYPPKESDDVVYMKNFVSSIMKGIILALQFIISQNSKCITPHSTDLSVYEDGFLSDPLVSRVITPVPVDIQGFEIETYVEKFIRLGDKDSVPLIQSLTAFEEILDRVAETCQYFIGFEEIQMTGGTLINKDVNDAK